MRNRIFSTIMALTCGLTISAQSVCRINGQIADTKLANSEKVKRVYLTHTNEFGIATEIDSAKVKKGAYTFKQKCKKGEPTLQYTITGFGKNKNIPFFLEQGTVTINTPAASEPEKSEVVGTPTNDTYAAYKAIAIESERKVAQIVSSLEVQHGTDWLRSAEGQREVKRIKAKEAINNESQALRFLIDHNDSPMTPLEIERTLLPKLSEAYADQATKAIAYSLQQHPYYHSLRNTVLANTLKVGTEAPNLTLPLLSGDVTHLTDYRGKHVILHFWYPDSDTSTAQFTELQAIYEAIKGNDKYIIISYALNDDIAAWKKAVTTHGLAHEKWLHVCDGAGLHSPAAKHYKVENTPKIVFIEPEGHAISLGIDTEELLMRIEQIESGDLYYLDMEK